MTKRNKMRVAHYVKRLREVRFIQREWPASGKLLIVLSYNCPRCTHFKKNMLTEKTNWILLTLMARCLARNCAGWLQNVRFGILFGAQCHIVQSCLFLFQINDVLLKLVYTGSMTIFYSCAICLLFPVFDKSVSYTRMLWRLHVNFT